MSEAFLHGPTEAVTRRCGNLLPIKQQIFVPDHDPGKGGSVILVIPIVPHVRQGIVIDRFAIVLDIDGYGLVSECEVGRIHNVIDQPGILVMQIDPETLVRTIECLGEELTFDLIRNQIGTMEVHFVEPVCRVSVNDIMCERER